MALFCCLMPRLHQVRLKGLGWKKLASWCSEITNCGSVSTQQANMVANSSMLASVAHTFLKRLAGYEIPLQYEDPYRDSCGAVLWCWKENHDNLQAAILNVELQFIYFNTYKL